METRYLLSLLETKSNYKYYKYYRPALLDLVLDPLPSHPIGSLSQNPLSKIFSKIWFSEPPEPHGSPYTLLRSLLHLKDCVEC